MNIFVGITTSGDDHEQRLRHEYVRAIVSAGGVPLIAPMVDDSRALKAYVSLLDALVISGGPAVTLGMDGTLPKDIEKNSERRLNADIALISTFLESRRPMLAICYGMQLVNALDGGTIYADVQRQKRHALGHSPARGADSHSVDVDPDSILYRILDRTRFDVNSNHIQAVKSLGTSFRASAHAPDGVIEALESTDGLILGVQFHPEKMNQLLPLFTYLVNQAQESKVAVTARNHISATE